METNSNIMVFPSGEDIESNSSSIASNEVVPACSRMGDHASEVTVLVNNNTIRTWASCSIISICPSSFKQLQLTARINTPTRQNRELIIRPAHGKDESLIIVVGVRVRRTSRICSGLNVGASGSGSRRDGGVGIVLASAVDGCSLVETHGR